MGTYTALSASWWAEDLLPWTLISEGKKQNLQTPGLEFTFLAQDRNAKDKYKYLIKLGFFLGTFKTKLVLRVSPGLCWLGFRMRARAGA